MTDTAMVIETMGDDTTGSRTDVNGDGLTDDADMVTTLESLGASSPAASLAELEPCDEHTLDFPECGDLSLDDPLVGCDCEGEDDGGGGDPLPPPPGPDRDGFNQCMNGPGGCNAQARDRAANLERWSDRRSLLCAASSGVGGFGAFYLFKKDGRKLATALFATWVSAFLIEWENRVLDHHQAWSDCRNRCAREHNIP